MAKKSVSLVDDVEELEDLSPEEQDVLAALTDLEGSQDARWQVFREAPGNGKPEGYLDTLSTPEIRMDEIKRRFGRGRYKVKGLRADGTYLKQLRFNIALDPEVASATAQPSGTDIRDVLTIMQENERVRADRDEKRSDRTRELMLTVIPGAMTMFGGIVTAIITRQPPPQQNVLSDLATIKAIMGPPAPPHSPIDDMVKLMDLGRKFGAGGDKDSTWLDVVKEAIATAGPALLEKLQGAAPSTGQAPTPAALPAPIPPTPGAAPIPSAGHDVKNPMLLMNWAREKLAYLTTKAAKNAEPDLYADWLVDEVPPGVDILEFAKYLAHPEWWTYLQQFSPPVAPYQGWFAQFRDYLIETLEEKFNVQLLPEVSDAGPRTDNEADTRSDKEV